MGVRVYFNVNVYVPRAVKVCPFNSIMIDTSPAANTYIIYIRVYVRSLYFDNVVDIHVYLFPNILPDLA